MASDSCASSSDHRLQFLLHDAGQVGTRFEKVLEIRGRKDQHFSSAIVAKVIVALPRLEHAGPVLEVGQFTLGLLREKIVGDPDGQLAVLMKLFDDLVVFRIVLESPAGVDRARNPRAG